MTGGGDPLDAELPDPDPASAAEVAAEALRALNRLTIGPPSPGMPGWGQVGDLYRVLGELRVLSERCHKRFDSSPTTSNSQRVVTLTQATRRPASRPRS